VLGLFLSPDNYVQAPGFSQNFNRYAYCVNNPLRYVDPGGEVFFFIFPYISYSPQGGIDFGVTGGVGFPGGGSVQVTVGYGGGEGYVSVGASVAGATVYAGYGGKSGFFAGGGFGFSPFGGSPYGTPTSNLFSAGITYSANGGWSYNQMGMQMNLQTGTAAFNPSLGYTNGLAYGWHGTDARAPSFLLASIDDVILRDPDLELAVKECPTCIPINTVFVKPVKGWYVPAIGGAGLNWTFHTGILLTVVEKSLYSKELGTWMGKDFKFRSQKWGGNGVTGGKNAYARTMSGKIGLLGKVVSVYSMYNSYQEWQIGKVSNELFVGDMVSGLAGTFGGIIGASWSIGWELGKYYGPSKWFSSKPQESVILHYLKTNKNEH
jgi:hypothetical protein